MKKDQESIEEDQYKINYIQKMKKNEELQNEIHFAISRKPLLNIRETGVYARVGKYMKIFSYLVLFTGIAVVLNSCMGGYVASEPAYVDYARPQRQYDNQIWIDGDWGWNSQTHVYVQKAGYWDKPRQGQSYVAGSWQTTQRGKSWSKGHWQKDAQQRNNQQKDKRQTDNKQNDRSGR
jgi:hypothetical protein